MRKAIEPFPAVIAAHTALSEPAESHFAGREMNDGVVDTAAAERAFRENARNTLFIGRKDIQRKRRRTGTHLGNDLGNIAESKHRKNRPENFLPHHLVVPGDAVEDSRLDSARRFIPAPSVHDFPLVNQAADAVKMLTVYNLSVAAVVQGVFVLNSDLLFYFRKKGFLHALRDIDVIGGYMSDRH